MIHMQKVINTTIPHTTEGILNGGMCLFFRLRLFATPSIFLVSL